MARETVVGLHAVAHALRGGRARRLLLVEGRLSRRLEELRARAEAAGVPVARLPRRELERLARGVRHQGAAAEVEALDPRGEFTLWLQRAPEAATVVAFDGVTDPHNLGACIRSAEAFGCGAVIVPRDRSADPSAPAVQKSACGALAHIALFRVVNLRRELERLREAGFWIVGLAGEAERPLASFSPPARTVLVLGSEGRGLRRLVREACDELRSIPLSGRVESLNVSVACGIALHHLAARRAEEE